MSGGLLSDAMLSFYSRVAEKEARAAAWATARDLLDHIAALEAKLAETERRLEMTEQSLTRSQAAHRKTLAELQDGKVRLR